MKAPTMAEMKAQKICQHRVPMREKCEKCEQQFAKMMAKARKAKP